MTFRQKCIHSNVAKFGQVLHVYNEIAPCLLYNVIEATANFDREYIRWRKKKPTTKPKEYFFAVAKRTVFIFSVVLRLIDAWKWYCHIRYGTYRRFKLTTHQILFSYITSEHKIPEIRRWRKKNNFRLHSVQLKGKYFKK